MEKQVWGNERDAIFQDQLDEGIRYRLKEQEIEEFYKWFSRTVLEGKRQGKSRVLKGMVGSNLKEETVLQTGPGSIHILAELQDLRLLYSAVSKLDMTENLILFFDQKDFWAVPKRALGEEKEAAAWFEQLRCRCEEGKQARISMSKTEQQREGEEDFSCWYTRTVEQVAEAYMSQGRSEKELERLRNFTIFPYRYTGVQGLVLKQDGIYEYGEKWVERHRYHDIEGAEYTDEYLYLIKQDNEEIMVPMASLGGVAGMEHFLKICSKLKGRSLWCAGKVREKQEEKLKARRNAQFAKKVVVLPAARNPAGSFKKKWLRRAGKKRSKRIMYTGSGSRFGGYLLITTAAVLTLAIIIWGQDAVEGLRESGRLGPFNRPVWYLGLYSEADEDGEADGMAAGGTDQKGDHGRQEEKGSRTEKGWMEKYMVIVPDDTVFDQVGPDGTYVSSGLFFTLSLPSKDWEACSVFDSLDSLTSSWADITVTGYRKEENPYRELWTNIPKTKEEYLKQMTENWGMAEDKLPDVAEYTYKEEQGCSIVRKEMRMEGGKYGYCEELNLLSSEYFYTVKVNLPDPEQNSIEMGRSVLDSFRLVDTSVGVAKQMEDAIFYGYYGKNSVMTSCLVLLERDMSDKEIVECLDQLKHIEKDAFYSNSGEILAVRKEGSRWMGIDCPSLQQNCYRETARKVSKIFQAEVILYDEFDGDLLMVAYCDKDRKKSYQRATSHNKWMLETEFMCYGREQDFPQDLLKYMDLSKEEAVAIWKDEEAIFQMDKWQELVSHMTKMPVPEEFVGFWDYKAFEKGFQVIRR